MSSINAETTTLPAGSGKRGPPVSLDEHGHVENTCCTWAPPPAQSSQQRRVDPASWSPTAATFGVKAPTEFFPPMYTLPDQSSHNYEEEERCAHHHGAPTETPPSDATQQQHNHQRTKSWTPEDQRRLNHIRLIYGNSSSQ